MGGAHTDLDLDDYDHDVDDEDGSHLFNMRRHYPLLWRFCISLPYELARQPRGRAGRQQQEKDADPIGFFTGVSARSSKFNLGNGS